MTHLDIEELYTTRLLVFLETEPQSNEYRQVILNKEEFKAFSMSLGKVTEKNGKDEVVEINLSEDIHSLPDLIEHL